ncbi:MAG: vWA domain-containing protein [Patescibacteria group bacterium]
MKKILFSFVAAATAIALVPMLAAFEAHVVNVTASIENALEVSTYSLDFGTVFPQEQLDKQFDIGLSNSFMTTDRVDDVEYMLRQKPKCVSNTNPTEHPQVKEGRDTGGQPNGVFQCPEGSTMMPFLCPYLSKAEITDDPGASAGENDMLVSQNGGHVGPLASFHGPTLVGSGAEAWDLQDTLLYQLNGRLAKSEQDLSDSWNIDLKVPCFGQQCAQDWAEFVADNDGDNNANAEDYIQPTDNESKIFGCDLWMEVKGISYTSVGCNDLADVMLVLDRSNSIDAGELAILKNAANAFVTALGPTPSGTHMGQSSFSTTGTLDQILTGVAANMTAAINSLVTSGFTNLFDGITLATSELTGINDRLDSTSPDFMVVITDGNPNRPIESTARAMAATAADAARAAGIEVFVVGVGSDVDAAYLINYIADDPAHYFAAADFDDLAGILEAIAECEELEP